MRDRERTMMSLIRMRSEKRGEGLYDVLDEALLDTYPVICFQCSCSTREKGSAKLRIGVGAVGGER